MDVRTRSGSGVGAVSARAGKSSAGGDGGGSSVALRGPDDNGVEKQGLQRRASNTAIAGMLERPVGAMNIERVNLLSNVVDGQSNKVYKFLMSNKETVDKRGIIEAAFRTCRDAFMEVSAALISLLGERSSNSNVDTK